MGGEVAKSTAAGLRKTIHERITRLRSVEYLLTTPFFERLWDGTEKEEREVILAWIEAGNKTAIQDWMETHPSIQYEEMSVSQLRRIARDKQIRNWSRLNKLELLVELQREKSRNDFRDQDHGGTTASVSPGNECKGYLPIPSRTS